MKFLLKAVRWFLEFCEEHNIRALLLLILVIIVGIGSSGEYDKLQKWAAQAFRKSEENASQIKHLEHEIKKQADKPVPPPVVIVKETKVYETSAKPFADPTLLARARKLRQQQQTSENNRR